MRDFVAVTMAMLVVAFIVVMQCFIVALPLALAAVMAYGAIQFLFGAI